MLTIPSLGPAEPAAEAGLLDELEAGEAVARSEAPPAVAASAPTARRDSDLYGLAPLDPPVRERERAEPAVSGPPKICPNCKQELSPNAKLCPDCGIDLKTGRPLITVEDDHLDYAYAYAEQIIRVISWLFPVGVYPFASEAFGTRKPWAIRAIGALTVIVSVWYFFVFIYNPSPLPGRKNLMLWSGAERLSARHVRSLAAEQGAELSESEAQAAAVELSPQFGTYRPSQLLTHQLLHADPIHLAGNLLFFFVLGSRVNALIGNILTAVLYPLLGIAAAAAHLMFIPSAYPQALLGASGAIMGLAGMYLVLFPVHKVHMAGWWRWGLIGGFQLSLKMWPVRGFWVVLFYIAFDVLYMALGTPDGVAHSAHVGGFVAGVAAALLLLVTRLVNARGGDILSAIFKRHAWKLIGNPNRAGIKLW